MRGGIEIGASAQNATWIFFVSLQVNYNLVKQTSHLFESFSYWLNKHIPSKVLGFENSVKL